MASEVTIDRRFCGPPDSGNGGYSCGLVALAIEGPAEVTLRVPPPLDRPLRIETRGDVVALLDGETLIAEGCPSAVDVEPGPPVSFAEAEAATARYPWYEGHPFPTCFVCGPHRDPGDGLVIFPGPVEGHQLFAAPWVPDASLAGADGTVGDEFVWAALDCPSGLVAGLFGDVGVLLLGRLTADLRAPVRAGEPHVLQAWTIERDGRKLHTASALFTADGTAAAVARAVWIEVA